MSALSKITIVFDASVCFVCAVAAVFAWMYRFTKLSKEIEASNNNSNDITDSESLWTENPENEVEQQVNQTQIGVKLENFFFYLGEREYRTSLQVFQPYLARYNDSEGKMKIATNIQWFVLVIFRFVVMAWGLTTLVFELKVQSDILRYFLFLTNLSFAVFVIHYSTSSFLTMLFFIYSLRKRPNPKIDMFFRIVSYPSRVLCEWNHHTSIVVSIGFWTVLVPLFGVPKGNLWSFVSLHGINAILNMIELLFLSNLSFVHVYHTFLAMLWPSAYLVHLQIRTVFYDSFWPYPILDYNNENVPAWLVIFSHFLFISAYLVSVVLHMIVTLIRDKVTNILLGGFFTSSAASENITFH
ncbi:VP3 [Acrasis kona]|uniref:VP3 n=1 Tax=Acrasis kona TaxID=1008807 RepID=A0AAW2ZAD3_9EUKA